MMYHTKLEENYILRNLLDPREKFPTDVSFEQLSLFGTEKEWR